jgi:hypothetical protein
VQWVCCHLLRRHRHIFSAASTLLLLLRWRRRCCLIIVIFIALLFARIVAMVSFMQWINRFSYSCCWWVYCRQFSADLRIGVDIVKVHNSGIPSLATACTTTCCLRRAIPFSVTLFICTNPPFKWCGALITFSPVVHAVPNEAQDC